MAEQNYTIFQRLGILLGPNNENKRKINKPITPVDPLLITTNPEEFKQTKTELQQQKYINDLWGKVENDMYARSIHNEPTRMASYYDFESMEFFPEISAALDIMSEEACLVGATEIPLLNGKTKTIEELYNNNYSNFWCYGVKISENKIKPTLVEKVIYKGEKDVYKITLDDGTEIKSTSDHKWLDFNNNWVETKDLTNGLSLKSIYTKKNYKGYEKVSLNDFYKDYEFTHIIVGEDRLMEQKNKLLLESQKRNQKIVIHHKSFNKSNNDPNELEYMLWDDHQKLHTDLNRERWLNEDFASKMRTIFSETAKKTWSKESFRVKRKEIMSDKMKNHYSKMNPTDRKRIHGKLGNKNPMYGSNRVGNTNPNWKHDKNHIQDINEVDYINYIISIKGDRRGQIEKHFNLTKRDIATYNRIICDKYSIPYIQDLDFIFKTGFNIDIIKDFIRNEKKPYRSLSKYCKKYNILRHDLKRFLNKKGYSDWTDLINTFGNHRVISVEYCGKEKVYDLFNSSVDSTFAVKCNNGMIISHNCVPSEQGRVLTIFSESERVRSILNELFNKTLDIETNLQAWTRNTIKYGDNFVYLHLEHGEGVVGCTQLPTIEIERFEDTDLIAKKKKIRFQYKTKDLQFEPFQIAHFRLLGDDRKLPYGTSILEKARRIYRQLVMSEDAMLIYRVVRAPERRVFKVFVGNMEDNDIEAYIQKIANKFKRTPIVDSKTGQIDLRYNQAGIDQDWFIPVRSESNQTVIDTLPGAQPLPIDDIEYLQKKLFAAIRVPAPFLGFGEAVGDGKNLSLLDIRFSRTINRIQKAMIQELNKIAIIHLFMLGYEEELDNFTLALTNPSTQAELLKIELWSQKLDVYSKAMADAGNGFSAISMVRAKKEILGMSDEEISLDLQQQRIEKAAAAELANTPSVIPKTGVFDKVDKIYGVKNGEGGPVPSEGGQETGNEFGGGPSPFGSGPEIGGGNEIGGETPPEGAEAIPGGNEIGGETPPPGGPEGAPQESFIPGKHKPLITEKLISKTDSYNKEIKEMIEKIDKSIL